MSDGIVVTRLSCDIRFISGRCDVGDEGLRWEMGVGGKGQGKIKNTIQIGIDRRS
jgi:hypothetical protein